MSSEGSEPRGAQHPDLNAALNDMLGIGRLPRIDELPPHQESQAGDDNEALLREELQKRRHLIERISFGPTTNTDDDGESPKEFYTIPEGSSLGKMLVRAHRSGLSARELKDLKKKPPTRKT